MRGPVGQGPAARWGPRPVARCCLMRGQRVWEEARALLPQGRGAAAGHPEAGVPLGGSHAAPTDGPPRGPATTSRAVLEERGVSAGTSAGGGGDGAGGGGGKGLSPEQPAQPWSGCGGRGGGGSRLKQVQAAL